VEGELYAVQGKGRVVAYQKAKGNIRCLSEEVG
jgi:hypothetical protein